MIGLHQLQEDLKMSDFLISNCLTFYENGEGDIDFVEYIVDHYTDQNDIPMQKQTLNMLTSMKNTGMFSKSIETEDDYRTWVRIIEKINHWEAAWMEFIVERPSSIVLCINETVRNYAKIVG